MHDKLGRSRRSCTLLLPLRVTGRWLCDCFLNVPKPEPLAKRHVAGDLARPPCTATPMLPPEVTRTLKISRMQLEHQPVQPRKSQEKH